MVLLASIVLNLFERLILSYKVPDISGRVAALQHDIATLRAQVRGWSLILRDFLL